MHTGEIEARAHTAFMQAMNLYQQGRPAEAIRICESILDFHPRHFESLNFLGIQNAQAGNFKMAIVLLDRAVAVNPGVASLLSNRGNVLKELGDLERALASYGQALALNPDYAAAYNNRGIVQQQLGRLDQALSDYDQAVKIKPDFSEAYNNRGNVLEKLDRLEQALDSYDRAIAVRPDNAEALNNRGNLLARLDRPDEALSSYADALAIRPDYELVYFNQGDVFFTLERYDDALASYDRALSIRPDYAEACNNRGNVLRKLGRLEEALRSYRQALKIRPDLAEASNNSGVVLLTLNRPDQALACCNQALVLRPDYAEAHVNRGNIFKALNRLDLALECYDKALIYKPDYAQAHFNRAGVLVKCMRLDEALSSYERALQLKPVNDFWWGAALHTRMIICQWQGLEAQLAELEKQIMAVQKVAPPFVVMALLDKPELQKRSAIIFSESECPASVSGDDSSIHMDDGRIRIGYYSADFYNHATAYLMAELFEKHASDRFEIYGFSFGPVRNDDMQQRLASAFDKFFEVGTKSDREIAELSRDMGIDIAVDLKGHTNNSRPGIFAARCAPVQVNYLGYPGTMGAKFIDYIIADRTIIPVESRHYYTEKVVSLPDSYQVNDSTRVISAREFSRRDVGLPESGFVYCCFNNTYKILPEMFNIWMRLLNTIEGSVLWLIEDNPWAVDNLRKTAQGQGVDGDRLVFAERLPLAEHLARHQCADLFIDTLPCNAHTTASDALWAGLPVLTCVGESFAARVAASLLKAIDLPELVAHSRQEYESLALELAIDRERLAAIKNRLQRNKPDSPLFNTQRFARHVESAYEAMFARSRAGLPPQHILIG